MEEFTFLPYWVTLFKKKKEMQFHYGVQEVYHTYMCFFFLTLRRGISSAIQTKINSKVKITRQV